jgi:hypothetical protein
MNYQEHPNLTSSAVRYNNNNRAGKQPVLFRFLDGNTSVQVNGRWHNVEIDLALFFSLPEATREAVLEIIIERTP